MKQPDNFTMIIFGAGGDLASRKLMPAIYQLAQASVLPERYRLIGVDRLDLSDQSFRMMIQEKIGQLAPAAIKDLNQFKEFCGQHLFYARGSFDEQQTFNSLARTVREVENRQGMCDNLLFYLATPPAAMPLIVKGLARAGLGGKTDKCPGWRKIIVEKPFGQDLASAKNLNATVGRVFKEDQIYRIDHYLAKETIQNILVFRFGNGMFDQLWNRDNLSHIEITIAEDFGVRHRGSYYEQAGLIRDIVQNHGLQMLAMIAMEAPESLAADDIRDQKVKVFKRTTAVDVVIGQYQGYQREKDVAPDSRVETFAAIKFFVNNKRWQGVPFYLRAGKNLAKGLTEIIIHFKHPPRELFGHTEFHAEANQIRFSIQPEEKISILFGAKRPGEEIVMEPVTMEFDYKKSFNKKGLTPYHLLILQAMAGDQTLFIRKDGVEDCWKIIDAIRTDLGDQMPIGYAINSWGPAESSGLLARDGFSWRLK